MRELYKYQFSEIEKLINTFIVSYALKEGITPAEARKKITKHDVEAFQAKAKQYVEDRDFSERANRELRLYNVTMRTSRLELLQEEIKLELMRLGTGEEMTLQEWLLKAGKTDLLRQAGILEMTVKTRESIEKAIKAIVNDNFQSATFSDRIWLNKRELNSQLGLGLERSLMRGENPIKWAGRLKRFLNDTQKNATYNAERLAVTETSRIQETISRQSYAAMGYKQMEIICEPSACKICKPHDGEIVDIDKAKMGDNVPLWHPWCKCTTAPHMDRAELDKAIKDLEMMGTVSVGNLRHRGIPLSGKEKTYDMSNITRGAQKIVTRTVEGTVNSIAVSESAQKSKNLDAVISYYDYSMSKALQLIEAKFNTNGFEKPGLLILTPDEMSKGVGFSYSASLNAILVPSVCADGRSLLSFLEAATNRKATDYACGKDPMSTFVHELMHWYHREFVVQKYFDELDMLRKSDINLFREKLNYYLQDEAEKIIINMKDNIDVGKISAYSKSASMQGDEKWEEVVTEASTSFCLEKTNKEIIAVIEATDYERA